MGTPGPGGVHSVFAMAVEAPFGNIEGASGVSDVYFDLGENLGFTTSGFEGLHMT